MPIKNFEINKDKIYYLHCSLKQFRENVLRYIVIGVHKITFHNGEYFFNNVIPIFGEYICNYDIDRDTFSMNILDCLKFLKVHSLEINVQDIICKLLKNEEKHFNDDQIKRISDITNLDFNILKNYYKILKG